MDEHLKLICRNFVIGMHARVHKYEPKKDSVEIWTEITGEKTGNSNNMQLKIAIPIACNATISSIKSDNTCTTFTNKLGQNFDWICFLANVYFSIKWIE